MERVFADLMSTWKMDPVMQWLLLAAVVLCPLLARGLFALLSTRYQRRKEAIDLWLRSELAKHDPSLELLVRNAYGVWLPAKSIRRIETMPFPSRVFLDLEGVAYWLDPAGDGSVLKLRWDAHRPILRRINLVVYLLLYLFSAAAAIYCFGHVDSKLSVLPNIFQALIGFVFLGNSIFCLYRGWSMVDADRVRERYPALFET